MSLFFFQRIGKYCLFSVVPYYATGYLLKRYRKFRLLRFKARTQVPAGVDPQPQVVPGIDPQPPVPGVMERQGKLRKKTIRKRFKNIDKIRIWYASISVVPFFANSFLVNHI